jgi:WD40 repeat protein
MWEATTTSWVENITFIPSGRGLITVDMSDTVEVWSLDRDRPVQEFKGDWRYADRYPTPVAVSSDGKWVASRSKTDDKVRVWNIKSGQVLASFQHHAPVTAIAFSSDGKYVASAAFSGELAVWEAATGREVASANSHDTIVAITVNQDATSFVTAEANISFNLGIDKSYSVKEWQRFNNQLQTDRNLEHVYRCYRIALSPTGNLVATAASNGAIQVWTSAGQIEIARLPHEQYVAGGSVGAIRFNMDENRVSTVSTWFDHVATVYEFGNISSGVHIQHKGRDKVFDNSERSISIGTNNAVLVSEPTTQKGIWEKWSASDRQTFARMSDGEKVTYIAFSPDGKFIAIARGHSTTIWQTNDGKEIARLSYELSGHMMEPGMYDLAFSPDSKYIATVDALHNRIWEVNTGREIARIEKETDQRRVSFSQDGRYLVLDLVLGDHLWAWRTDDLIVEACSRLTRNLTPDEWRQYLGYEPYRKTCSNLP